MIKTIKKITGVGKFSNYETRATGLEHDFTSFNVIYGFNTYGKTTICDILKDIDEDTVVRTQQRKTIPAPPNQSVIINCIDQGGAGSVLSLSADHWNNNTLKDNIYVFDSEFMLHNVFSGLSVIDARETKENFTDFILGSEGVELASKLEECKIELKLEKGKSQELIPSSQAGRKDSEIQQYIALVVSSTDEDLQAEQIEVQRQIDEITRKEGLRDEILNCKGITYSEYKKGKELLGQIKTLMEILLRTYHISADIVTEIEKHISNYMSDYPKAVQWLQVGYTKIVSKNEVCPFCGQSTKNNPFYTTLSQQYFSDDYRKYILELNEELDKVEIDWAFTTLSSSILLLERIFDGIENYDSRFNDKKSEFKDLHSQSILAEETLTKFSEAARKTLTAAIDNKHASPQVSYTVDFTEFFIAIERYNEIADNVTELVRGVNVLILKIQAEMKDKPQTDATDNLAERLNLIKTHRTRLAEENSCKLWAAQHEKIIDLESEVKRLSDELESNQNQYLNDYFNRISALFQELGARDFEIRKGVVSNRGLKKVFGISITYKGVVVTEQSQCVFSESDRRALALAIFIAKIEKFTQDKLNNTILIFDDPATSFDDNRIKSVISLIYGLSQKVNQTFIFAHHYNFIFNVFLIHNTETMFFKINPISDVSNLGIFDLNSEEEFGTEQWKRLIQIMKFNAGNCARITIPDLRIFMEIYLDTVFAKQYYENGLATLKFGERIDKYRELGVITESVALRLHAFRESFNPESHLYLSTNDEEIRTESCNLINFLFEKIHLTD